MVGCFVLVAYLIAPLLSSLTSVSLLYVISVCLIIYLMLGYVIGVLYINAALHGCVVVWYW